MQKKSKKVLAAGAILALAIVAGSSDSYARSMTVPNLEDFNTADFYISRVDAFSNKMTFVLGNSNVKKVTVTALTNGYSEGRADRAVFEGEDWPTAPEWGPVIYSKEVSELPINEEIKVDVAGDMMNGRGLMYFIVEREDGSEYRGKVDFGYCRDALLEETYYNEESGTYKNYEAGAWECRAESGAFSWQLVNEDGESDYISPATAETVYYFIGKPYGKAKYFFRVHSMDEEQTLLPAGVKAWVEPKNEEAEVENSGAGEGIVEPEEPVVEPEEPVVELEEPVEPTEPEPVEPEEPIEPEIEPEEPEEISTPEVKVLTPKTGVNEYAVATLGAVENAWSWAAAVAIVVTGAAAIWRLFMGKRSKKD